MASAFEGMICVKGDAGMRRFCMAAIATAVCGCATTPISNSEAHDVPDSRIHSRQWLTSAPGTSMLTIKRDSGFMGSACAIEVFMDGEAIADLRTSEKVTLYVRPGKHLFGGGSADASLVSEAGKPDTLRVSSEQGGDIRIAPSGF